MTKTTSFQPSQEPVVADLRPTAAGSDRVCASCGEGAMLVNADQSVKVWGHARPTRWAHQIPAVMSRAQWDKWKR